MPASYPNASKAFTTKSAGQTIDPNHINDLQLEVTAIENDLIAGLPVARGGTGLTSVGLSGQAPLVSGSSLAYGVQSYPADGRLTITTGTPVTTADVTAAGTLYYTPYTGSRIALYNGSTGWGVFTFTELSIAVPAVGNQVYDVFVDYNSGTPALALTAWTSDTARATALTTQNGVLVKTGATNQRYVGTVRTVTASQLNDSVLLRHVWNYYHRLPRVLRVTDATNSWTYDSATYQQANNSTANQVDVVVGVAEVPIDLQVLGYASNPGGAVVSVAIGLDGLTPATGVMGMRSTVGANSPFTVQAALKTYPAVGRHYFAWIESGGGATTTWYGDNNTPTLAQAGLHGVIYG